MAKYTKYRFIDDLTSDVMFEAYGKDLRELFENAAEALFSVICQVGEVQRVGQVHFQVQAVGVARLGQ